MSIDRDGTLIVWVCDGCGEELEPETEDFYEALKELREQGWQARKNANGQWEHYCETCK